VQRATALLTLIIVAAARVICLNAQRQPIHQHAQCISFSEPRPGIADYIGVLNFTGNMADVEQISVSRTANSGRQGSSSSIYCRYLCGHAFSQVILALLKFRPYGAIQICLLLLLLSIVDRLSSAAANKNYAVL